MGFCLLLLLCWSFVGIWQFAESRSATSPPSDRPFSFKSLSLRRSTNQSPNQSPKLSPKRSSKRSSKQSLKQSPKQLMEGIRVLIGEDHSNLTVWEQHRLSLEAQMQSAVRQTDPKRELFAHASAQLTRFLKEVNVRVEHAALGKKVFEETKKNWIDKKRVLELLLPTFQYTSQDGIREAEVQLNSREAHRPWKQSNEETYLFLGCKAMDIVLTSIAAALLQGITQEGITQEDTMVAYNLAPKFLAYVKHNVVEPILQVLAKNAPGGCDKQSASDILNCIGELADEKNPYMIAMAADSFIAFTGRFIKFESNTGSRPKKNLWSKRSVKRL